MSREEAIDLFIIFAGISSVLVMTAVSGGPAVYASGGLAVLFGLASIYTAIQVKKKK